MTRARLQQERSRVTRRSIIEAAEALWRERDFDSVSVEDVCQRAGVAKGTFYFYFPRKEHLLVMTVFGRFMPREPELQALLESKLDTAAACAQLLTKIGERAMKLAKPLVLRAVEESFQHFRQISLLEGGDRSLHNVYEPLFLRGKARGEVHDHWDLDMVSRTLGWATLQEIFLWSNGATSDADFLPNLRERAELVANGAGVDAPELAKPARARKVAAVG